MGETWSIPVRPPLAELLLRQHQRSCTRWPQGCVFPNSRGNHLSYSDWFNLGWHRLLEKSGVKLRVGNAQKALRRTWIASALVCGLNPKQVAAHVGHTTTRMVNDVYDSFIDPASWPEEEERQRLATIFGFEGTARTEVSWARTGTQAPLGPRKKKPAELSCRRGERNLEHETGFEPATSTLATFMRTPKSLRIPARKPQGAAPSRICRPVWARSGHAFRLAANSS